MYCKISTTVLQDLQKHSALPRCSPLHLPTICCLVLPDSPVLLGDTTVLQTQSKVLQNQYHCIAGSAEALSIALLLTSAPAYHLLLGAAR
jgi:hypothetical protein